MGVEGVKIAIQDERTGRIAGYRKDNNVTVEADGELFNVGLKNTDVSEIRLNNNNEIIIQGQNRNTEISFEGDDTERRTHRISYKDISPSGAVHEGTQEFAEYETEANHRPLDRMDATRDSFFAVNDQNSNGIVDAGEKLEFSDGQLRMNGNLYSLKTFNVLDAELDNNNYPVGERQELTTGSNRFGSLVRNDEGQYYLVQRLGADGFAAYQLDLIESEVPTPAPAPTAETTTPEAPTPTAPATTPTTLVDEYEQLLAELDAGLTTPPVTTTPSTATPSTTTPVAPSSDEALLQELVERGIINEETARAILEERVTEETNPTTPPAASQEETLKLPEETQQQVDALAKELGVDPAELTKAIEQSIDEKGNLDLNKLAGLLEMEEEELIQAIEKSSQPESERTDDETTPVQPTQAQMNAIAMHNIQANGEPETLEDGSIKIIDQIGDDDSRRIEWTVRPDGSVEKREIQPRTFWGRAGSFFNGYWETCFGIAALAPSYGTSSALIADGADRILGAINPFNNHHKITQYDKDGNQTSHDHLVGGRRRLLSGAVHSLGLNFRNGFSA